jgi:membrane-associated protease RseP (regulator of RpoE activity)
MKVISIDRSRARRVSAAVADEPALPALALKDECAPASERVMGVTRTDGNEAREFSRSRGARRGGVVLLLAATLAAGTGVALGAEQVERDDQARPAPSPAPAAAPAPEMPAEPARPAPPALPAMPSKPAAATQAERDRDAKLEDAKRRLEQAAAEVAALSSEIASKAMQNMGSAFAGGPRRSIIGVQIDAAEGGNGAKVRDISPGGAAEAAGIKVGDTIVAVNGTTIKGGAREVVRMLREVEPDTTVNVRVMRDGKPKDFKVTARRFDARTFVYSTAPDVDFDFDFDPSRLPFGPFGPSSAISGGLGGMELTALTPQLARYFGTDKGLLVVRAPKSEVYKLQDGDVILNIDGRVPSSGSHVTRILRSYSAGETLTMHIMRERKAVDLQITLPDESRVRRTRAARIATSIDDEL